MNALASGLLGCLLLAATWSAAASVGAVTQADRRDHRSFEPLDVPPADRLTWLRRASFDFIG